MVKTRKDHIYQVFLNLLFVFVCILVLLPFILVVSASLSHERDIIDYGYSIIPKRVSFDAFKYIFKNPDSILQAYKVTITFSAIYTVMSVFFMACLAFMLSKRNLRFKRQISFYVYFITLFSGGLVPTYILITQYLNLSDSIWVYILPGLISPWYVFMMRTFFQGIPYEITEAATVDGASEYYIFFRIILPLSKPVIAAVSLFQLLTSWNNWYTSMLYINDESLQSLQYLLQRIMNNIQLMRQTESMVNIEIDIPSETARMAMAVIVAGPALIVFPFFQKYFVKGMTVGSVKG